MSLFRPASHLIDRRQRAHAAHAAHASHAAHPSHAPLLRTAFVAGLLAAAFGAAHAQSGGSPSGLPGGTGGPGGRPPGPPPEAIEACKGKTAGATVTFTLRDGKALSGTCQLDNGVLAARPPHPPGAGASSSSR